MLPCPCHWFQQCGQQGNDVVDSPIAQATAESVPTPVLLPDFAAGTIAGAVDQLFPLSLIFPCSCSFLCTRDPHHLPVGAIWCGRPHRRSIASSPTIAPEAHASACIHWERTLLGCTLFCRLKSVLPVRWERTLPCALLAG